MYIKKFSATGLNPVNDLAILILIRKHSTRIKRYESPSQRNSHYSTERIFIKMIESADTYIYKKNTKLLPVRNSRYFLRHFDWYMHSHRFPLLFPLNFLFLRVENMKHVTRFADICFFFPKKKKFIARSYSDFICK